MVENHVLSIHVPTREQYIIGVSLMKASLKKPWVADFLNTYYPPSAYPDREDLWMKFRNFLNGNSYVNAIGPEYHFWRNLVKYHSNNKSKANE
jgi:hypothetical protein